MAFRFTATASRALRVLPGLVAALSFTLLPANYASASTALPNTQVMQFAPPAAVPSGGSGGAASGAPGRLNFNETATSADALTRVSTTAGLVEFNRGRLSTVPSVPATGARTQ